MLTADTVAPVDPAKLNHWLAIVTSCREYVRSWIKAQCEVEGAAFLRNLIEHFSSVSVPQAAASLTFQFHRARGNAARAAKDCVLDRSIAFPTSKLTKNEIDDGWTLCTDPECKPTTGGRRIIGVHAHPLLPAKEQR